MVNRVRKLSQFYSNEKQDAALPAGRDKFRAALHLNLGSRELATSVSVTIVGSHFNEEKR